MTRGIRVNNKTPETTEDEARAIREAVRHLNVPWAIIIYPEDEAVAHISGAKTDEFKEVLHIGGLRARSAFAASMEGFINDRSGGEREKLQRFLCLKLH